MAEGELATVGRFASLGAAEAARLRLAAEGIEALVLSQDAVRIDPFRSRGGPAIRLQVRPGDAARAREVLAGE